MAPSSELEAIGNDYFNSLNELTFNSRPIIVNLTVIAQENIVAAPYITKAIQNRIQSCLPTQKLFTLYLLDSICKNIGSPYTVLFGSNLYNIFTQTYSLVSDLHRKKLIDLFKTWLTTKTATGLTLFPIAQLQKIEGFLVQAAPSRQQQQQIQQIQQIQQKQQPTLNQQFQQFISPNPIQQPQPQQNNYNYQSQNFSIPNQNQNNYQNLLNNNNNQMMINQKPTEFQPFLLQKSLINTSSIELPLPTSQSLISDIDNLNALINKKLTLNQSDTKSKERLTILSTLKNFLSTQVMNANDLLKIKNQLQSMIKKEQESMSQVQIQNFNQNLYHNQNQFQNQAQSQFQNLLPNQNQNLNQIPIQNQNQNQNQNNFNNVNTNIKPIFGSLQNIIQATDPNNIANRTGINNRNGGGLQNFLNQRNNNSNNLVNRNSQFNSFSNVANNTNTNNPPPNLSNLFQSLKQFGLLNEKQNNNKNFPPQKDFQNSNVIPDNENSSLAAFFEVNIYDDNFLDITQATLNDNKFTTKFQNFLNADKLNNCAKCGKRFSKDNLHLKGAHLDWHFRVHEKLKESSLVQSRNWYMNDIEWIGFDDRETLDELDDPEAKTKNQNNQNNSASSGNNNGNSNSNNAANREEHYVIVPTESTDMNTKCAICKEDIHAIWSDALGEWIWENSIKEGPKIFHWPCYQENIDNIRNSTAKPESPQKSKKRNFDEALSDSGNHFAALSSLLNKTKQKTTQPSSQSYNSLNLNVGILKSLANIQNNGSSLMENRNKVPKRETII
ncbi:Pcf11p ASCRUDRAFT_68590 [Ascoidea rubescens DSM 1968]|uniref:CID domain-containing protein n=1 Tax=Ascoidea rubescens DSM 1968 TaxID=1344418 RepID=A0A1D2VMC8_9ASCO|nr:hypothetical protein ASCRUDRAFT_68590 [Ascoidea rubescens DSM 1968]ODV62759.1 hypothetical protein ASCRUDRAFT_68590 [Ascoidea rubescens DSM 1968]